MTKKTTDLKRNQELQRLVDEQEDDMSSAILFPEVITPLAIKTLEGLSINEKSAILLSVIGKMSNREIGLAMQRNESTIRGFIKRSYKILRKKLR